jgi:class 3 adenylate cyclase/DNA-binding CsgD family transcriptional regulator
VLGADMEPIFAPLCGISIREMTDSPGSLRPYDQMVTSFGAETGITTIVFADVEGSTALVDKVGDHAGVAAVLHQLGRVRERLESYGGREVKSMGDGLMLTFSSPRQAVGFALATQRALAGTAPLVRIGINTGEVFDVLTDPIGGAVNAASRIAGRAEGGEVLVADVVRQLIGLSPAIRFADRGRVHLRGFTERWHLWAAEDSAAAASARGTVGRGGELAAIRALIASTASGVGQTMLIEGEAGIGKTHLVGEAVGLARGATITVIETIADEVMRRPGALPHGLLEDPRVGDPERDRLRDLLRRSAHEGDPEDLSYAVVEASVDAVESLTRTGAALVIIEDAHWADDLSLAVMRALVRRAPLSRFSVIISMRPTPRSAALDRLIELVIDSRGHNLRVVALDELDLNALVSSLTGAAPGPALREWLRSTAGNPLFVTELLRSLEDEGLLRIEAGIADVPSSVMPRGLSETLVRRLSWLPGETRELLRLASLLGTSFTLADLSTITGRPILDVAAWLREASLAGLVIGDGDRLTFRHDLIREAVYGHMLAAERRDLHRAAAQALAAAGAPTQQVARQFARGAVPGDLDAVRWLERAGDEAISIAPTAALALYEEALALAPEHWSGRDAMQARMIEPLAWCGRFTRAEEVAADILASSPGVDVEFAALRGLSAVYGNSGDIARAIEAMKRAAALPEAPAAEVVRQRCMTAQLQLLTGTISAVEARSIATATLEESLVSGEATTQCLARQVLGGIDAVTGYGAEGCRQLQQAIALHVSGRATRVSYLIPDLFYAMGLLELDDAAGALEASARARIRHEQHGALSQLPMAYGITGAAYYYSGRFDEAVTEVEAGASVAADTGNSNFVLFFDSVLARIALRRGDLAGAAAALASGTARLSSGGSMFGADWLFDAQAQYMAASGDLAGALMIAEMTWAQTEFIRFFYGYRERGVFIVRLARDAGRDDLAGEVAASVEEGSRRSPAVSAHAAALQCRGIVERDADLLLVAAEQFRSTPLRPSLALCCEDSAAALSADGRSTEAITALTEAAGIYADTGAFGDAGRVDEALRSLGVRPKRARPQRPTFGWDSLTPTEVRVSQLVAEGLTNPEIGGRLFVSRRTVETHLAHVFRKLGFVSRSQLAAELTRHEP